LEVTKCSEIWLFAFLLAVSPPVVLDVELYTVADISIWPWIYALYEIYDNAAEVCCLVQVSCTAFCGRCNLFRVHFPFHWQTTFNGLATVPFVKDWYLRCIQRGASKKATTVCVITESA
jgi:glutathione S-transferase